LKEKVTVDYKSRTSGMMYDDEDEDREGKEEKGREGKI